MKKPQQRGSDASLEVVVAAGQPTPAPKPKRFKVWEHGILCHDGCDFAIGEELPLSEAELLALGLIQSGVAVPISEG